MNLSRVGAGGDVVRGGGASAGGRLAGDRELCEIYYTKRYLLVIFTTQNDLY